MKVLQVINSLSSGGAEKLVTDLCIAYQKQGVDVELALLNGQQTAFMERLVRIDPNIKIHVLGDGGDMYSPKHIFKLRKLLNQYDIVHVHLFPSFYWVGFATFLGKTRAKLFYTEHNTTNRRRNHPLLKHIDKIIYKRYTKIISISDAVHKNLQEHLGGLKNLVFQINNGIDLKEVNSAKPYDKPELGFDENAILLLQVSSFTPQKDQRTLIQSLLHLPESTQLILVGDGPLRTEQEKLADSLKLSDRVHFYGLRNDVPRLLKTVDVVILSSNFEGLSLSCVEGLASGKPFMAADVPGLTEVVQGHGILFPKGDHESLALNITKLLENKAHYKNTVEKCMERSKDFDIEDMVKGYLQSYTKALKK
ncbi:MAG: glycosyltransferase [Allomuricauda sp.]